MGNLFYLTPLTKGKEWTEDMRQSQASIVKEVMALEQKAVIGIEKIVKAIYDVRLNKLDIYLFETIVINGNLTTNWVNYSISRP